MENETTVHISNPNPWFDKVNSRKMVAYKVTGNHDAVEQFKQWKASVSSTGSVGVDDSGNPLFHVGMDKAYKLGLSCDIHQFVSKEDPTQFYYSRETQGEKNEEEIIKGLPEVAQMIYAKEELTKARAFANAITKTETTRINAYRASVASTSPVAFADL